MTEQPSAAPPAEDERKWPSYTLGIIFCTVMLIASIAFWYFVWPELTTYETVLLLVMVLPFVGYFFYMFGYSAVTGRKPNSWFRPRR